MIEQLGALNGIEFVELVLFFFQVIKSSEDIDDDEAKKILRFGS